MSWQRPNWKNKNEYPVQNSTSANQWAWEFLRRNPDYEADYKRCLSDDAKNLSNSVFGLVNEACLIREHLRTSPDNPELLSSLKLLLETHTELLEKPIDTLFVKPEPFPKETVKSWLERVDFTLGESTSATRMLAIKWFGIDLSAYLPPTHIDDLNSIELPLRPIFRTSRIMGGLVSRYKVPEDCSKTPELQKAFIKAKTNEEKQGVYNEMQTLDEEYRLGKKGNKELEEIRIRPTTNSELWLQFDLSLPIKKQLEVASLRFNREKEKYENDFGNVTNSRSRKVNYQNYLRVLDAYYSGADKYTISEELFPHVDNEQPSYLGLKTVKNHYKAALELQSYGYIKIPLSS